MNNAGSSPAPSTIYAGKHYQKGPGAAFQADDRGVRLSLPAPFLGNKMKPRNYLVKLALFKKAGKHRKSFKALRKTEKQRGYNSMVE